MEKITYSDDGKMAYFDGYKFRKDPRTGYFLSTRRVTGFGRRIRLHVYVWTKYNGSVPKGYHVHHKDENKDHNDIDNLALLESHEHVRWHGAHASEELRQKWRDNLNEKARPNASEWHKSEAGHEWHLQHYAEMGDKLHERTMMVCDQCGKEFMGIPHQRFCCNACKSTWRRQHHLDDEVRICVVCGRKFNANRYGTKKYCSPVCRRKSREEAKETRVCV